MTTRALNRCLAYASALCVTLVAFVARDARCEVPLYEQDPYDQITLDENNDNAVIKVLPLDLPDRRVPDPFPKSGKIEVQLVDKPESKYEIEWHAIAKVELFHDLVLKKANELVQAGRLDDAYDYFQFLLEKDPKLPGLDAAIDAYLYEEAKASQVKEHYEDALAMLRQLHDRNPQWPGLERALGVVTERLVERYVKADNYWAARQMLRNLAAWYPENAVVAKWEGQFQSEATSLLAEGRKAEEAGQLREAHRAGRRLMRIWPQLPEGRQFIDSIQQKYPRVVVGVTLPGTPGEPAPLHDWASRRSDRLVSRTLMEFVGRGTEGGKYVCPFGEMQIQQLGLRLAFRIDREKSAALGAAGLTGYGLARQLLAMADPSDPAYRTDWAELLAQVSVHEVYGVDADLRRPHVRPEALLRTVVLEDTGAEDAAGSGAAPASNGPYLVDSRAESQSEDDVVYVRNPRYASRPRQPKEIVERYYAKGTDAIKALERREIDVLDRVNPWDLDRARSLRGVVVEPYGVPVVHCLVPNPNRPFTARGEFRRALVYGIHREAILARLLRLTSGEPPPGNQVVSGPFSPGMSRDDPLDYAYDHAIEPRAYEPHLAVALAQVALSEVAAATEKSTEKQGSPVSEIPEIVLAYPAHEIARVACTSIQRQLKLVDIPVTLRELPGGIPSRIPDDVDLLYAELTMCEPVVDARRVLGEDGIAGASSNFMNQALRQLDEATDWAQAAERLRAIHRLAYTEVSVVPLWQLIEHCAYHESLKGVGTDPVSLYQNVEQWEPSTQYAAATEEKDEG